MLNAGLLFFCPLAGQRQGEASRLRRLGTRHAEMTFSPSRQTLAWVHVPER
jgi:hypothetical protein